jgi:hypothetical protein
METYDIYFKEGTDFANKGFSLIRLRLLEWLKICWLNAKDT